MKRIILLLFIIINFPAFSQTPNQVFDCKEIVFFGLDFSNAAMIGPSDFKSGDEIKNKYFEAWNNVIFNERKKYDLAESFSKESIQYDFSVIKKRNAQTSPDKIVTDISPKLSTEDISRIIKDYKSENFKEGTGLVFIIESFNKPDEKGNFFVVFFDIASRKILLSEKLSEKPGGMGLKNFWIRTIYNGLDDIEDDLWDSWKKKYSH